jgi:hypothetical protein
VTTFRLNRRIMLMRYVASIRWTRLAHPIALIKPMSFDELSRSTIDIVEGSSKLWYTCQQVAARVPLMVRPSVYHRTWNPSFRVHTNIVIISTPYAVNAIPHTRAGEPVIQLPLKYARQSTPLHFRTRIDVKELFLVLFSSRPQLPLASSLSKPMLCVL